MTAQNPPIFAQTAPLYFARGISVIPLEPWNSGHQSAGKKPIPMDWANWADKPVPVPLQELWIQKYAYANIGIAAGPQSRIMFLDVDSTDPRILTVLRELMPESPWTRIGQKGFIAAYRYIKGLKNFKIKDKDNNMLVEFLGEGNQAVIPPSIHPKTHKPYIANCDLLEVYDFLPQPPAELETILREALQQAGFELSHSGYSRMTDWVPSGTRDTKMTSMAGMFARDITVGRLTLQEALDRMDTWAEKLVENVAGDDIDVGKGKAKIIEFLQRDVLGERKRPLPIGWDKDLNPKLKEECNAIFTRDHEEWTADEIKQYLVEQFSQFPGNQAPERTKAIKDVIEKIARSPSLSNLDKEMVYSYIHQVSRIPGMTVVNLRKRVKELQQGNISGTNHSEIANAMIERLEADAGEIRQHMGGFWQWQGAQWERIDESDIMRRIAEEFGDLECAKRFSDHKGIISVMRNLVKSELSANPLQGINFANGYLTKDLRLLPHAPEYGATTTLPYRYMPELGDWNRMPRFAQLMADAWSKDDDYAEKVDALQEMIAASLYGLGPLVQRSCLLYGAADSGKSTILNVITGLFPREAVSNCPPDQWHDKFAPATMAGKLLNICGELPDKKPIDGRMFKAIISGEMMQGQFKNQPLFDFQPMATHWFASNHLPKTSDTSEGFNRRFLILEFKKPVTREKKVLGLHVHILTEEREAIAAWAVQAIGRLVENKGPTLPESHEFLMMDMAADNNSVRFFFNRCARVLTYKKVSDFLRAHTDPATAILNGHPFATSVGLGSKGITIPRESLTSIAAWEHLSSSNPISEDQLYGEYIVFCQQAGGVKPVGLRAFRHRLREMEYDHGYQSKLGKGPDGSNEVMMYFGIVVGAVKTM